MHTLQDSTAHYQGSFSRHAPPRKGDKESPNDQLRWDFRNGIWKDLGINHNRIAGNQRATRAVALSGDYLRRFLNAYVIRL